MKKSLAAIAAVAAVILSGCATASTGPDLKALHYEGGSLSAKKFKDCLDPSSRSGYDPGDNYVAYPTRQVSYDATGSEGAESGRFKVVSKDNAELYVPVTVTFTLDTGCEVLQKFHETLGARFNASFDPDGTSADTPGGWVELLDYAIGKPLDSTLDRVAQNYNWRDVWNNPQVKAELEAEVNDNIDDLVTRQAGGAFFKDFNVLVMKPDPVDEGLKQAIADEQNAIAQANAAKKKAEADELTARAEERLAEAQAKTKRAEIDGFGGIENYLRAKCIESPTCGNPFRDQYLYGGSPAQ